MQRVGRRNATRCKTGCNASQNGTQHVARKGFAFRPSRDRMGKGKSLAVFPISPFGGRHVFRTFASDKQKRSINMKNHYNALAALALTMSAFAFCSCTDEDTMQSMALSGEWRGDFGMYYDYEDSYGRRYTFASYDSYITFIPDYSHANHGRGTQVDYYDRGPYEYQYYRFSWSVENGYIYLYYDYDYELDTRISSYRMTNDYFSGRFYPSGTSFQLYKVVDFYDWTPYVNTYGYGPRHDWGGYAPYYAPYSRSDAAAPADSAAASADSTSVSVEGTVLKRGRRTTK